METHSHTGTFTNTEIQIKIKRPIASATYIKYLESKSSLSLTRIDTPQTSMLLNTMTTTTMIRYLSLSLSFIFNSMTTQATYRTIQTKKNYIFQISYDHNRIVLKPSHLVFWHCALFHRKTFNEPDAFYINFNLSEVIAQFSDLFVSFHAGDHFFSFFPLSFIILLNFELFFFLLRLIRERILETMQKIILGLFMMVGFALAAPKITDKVRRQS